MKGNTRWPQDQLRVLDLQHGYGISRGLFKGLCEIQAAEAGRTGTSSLLFTHAALNFPDPFIFLCWDDC